MLAERTAQHVGCADHLVIERDDLGVHVPAPRKSQQLIGELRTQEGRVLRFLEQCLLLIAIELQFEELMVAGDDEQQVVEVVGDAAGELTDSLHLLGLRQAPLALPQRFLDVLAVAQVVDHAGEVAPALCGELAYREVERKRRAILAPPADLAADADDLPDAGRKVVGDISVMLRLVWLRHEHSDVLADQFRRAIPEQTLGRRVNALYEPLVIDGDDGGDGGLENAAQLGTLRLCRRGLARGCRHGPFPKSFAAGPLLGSIPSRA
jgi:hypothetical protein